MLDKDTSVINLMALRTITNDVELLSREAASIDPSIDSVFNEIRQVRLAASTACASSSQICPQTLSIPLHDAVSEYVGDARARSTKYAEAQPAKVALILERLARFHATKGPAQADLANKRSRERDMVGRLVRQRA